ncbi:hypothetical protein NECID01_0964 [Nematocida sp. AWRm77]|nr:hypothetical protein NECID01_0964 [Nematocida sp. AWRm77]
MGTFYPAALNELYRAVIFSSFRGYAPRVGSTSYTLESIASITYDRLCALSEAKAKPSSLVYTLVLGKFTRGQSRKLAAALEKKSLFPAGSAAMCGADGFVYLVLKVPPSVYSLLAGPLSSFVLTCTPEVYTLRLSMPLPEHFPNELFCAVSPTCTLLLLNVHSTHEELLMHFAEGGIHVEALHYTHTVAHVCLGSLEHAERLYTETCGASLNGHCMFTCYYPESLASLGLWLPSF